MLVSAEKIHSQMSTLRERDPWQMECMRLCTVATGLFNAAAEVARTPQDHDSQEERELVSQQVLGIRVLNSIGAADVLILRGFYQPAGIMIRDIVECSYLLDLFSRRPHHLPKWIALGKEAGLKEYRPSQVREMLNVIDGIGRETRQGPYTFYSRYGTHPNSEAVDLIAPEGAVRVGPFADETRLIALSYDLTRFSVLAAIHLSRWLRNANLRSDQAYHSLEIARTRIEDGFMNLNEHLNRVPRKEA